MPRRAYSDLDVAAGYRWDDFLLDLDAYRLERRGAPIPLEPKALNLLALIVLRPGHLFTKQEIFDAVWPDTAVTDHALTRVVAQLRRGLGDEAREARYIETVPTRGYRWLPHVERVDLVEPVAIAVGPRLPPLGSQAAIPDATPSPATIAAQPVAAAGRTTRPVFGGLAAALVAATIVLLSAVWLQRADSMTAAQTADGATSAERGWKALPVGLPRQLTTHEGLDMQPSLSPQGDAVAYISDRSGSLEIYVRTLGADAAETAVTADGGQNMQPAWSPDGRLLAFHSAARGGIWVVPSRGGLPRQILAAGSRPDWSPDGLRIAYQSDEHSDVTPSAFGAGSGSTIWIADAGGANVRELTRSGSPLGGHAAPTWSPSGRFIAFTVFEAGDDNGVWMAAVETGVTHAIERRGNLFELAFAPDESAIYAAGGAPFITRLPFDAASGKLAGPRTVIPVAGVPGVRGLSVAPDGKTLAFGGLALTSQSGHSQSTRPAPRSARLERSRPTRAIESRCRSSRPMAPASPTSPRAAATTQTSGSWTSTARATCR